MAAAGSSCESSEPLRRPWYVRGVRAQPWALGGMVLLAAGCVTHRGSWKMDPPTPPASAADGVDLVVLANSSPEDRGARAVAARVEQVLAEGRPSVVLWLGNVASSPMRSATPTAQRRGPRCHEPSEAWGSPAADVLARAVRRTHADASFAVLGVLDHRCGHGPALRQADAQGTHPWRMPGSHAVLRVHTDGSVHERMTCGLGGCTITTATPAAEGVRPLVDLVLVDLAPWLHPAGDPMDRHREDELQVQALDAMLATVAEVPPDGAPPRILVSNVPVEAGGEHGLGALWPHATFHALPPRLRSMLLEGHFAGVIAGHDRSLYASGDLSDAIKRADRAWLRTPVFQVVAGAVARPNRRAAMALRRRRVRQSQAYAPTPWSDHPGFTVVHLRGERAELVLHAHRGRHWESASMVVPLRPPPHPARTPSPHMAPCRDCPPIPASER